MFVFVPNSFESVVEYREVRQNYLRNYCFLVHSKHRRFRRVVGIATDADKNIVVILPDSGDRYLSKMYNDEWMRTKGFLKEETDGI